MGEETTLSDDQLDEIILSSGQLDDICSIHEMLTDVHALYLAAYAELDKARVAERELRRKMQEVYGVKESEKHGNIERMRDDGLE